MRALELFTGAGGLAMGVTLAGFKPVAIVEWDRWACDTIRENQDRGFPLVKDWPLVEGDVREFNLSLVPEGIDLIAGGPPCQPFSMGGKHKANEDHRDMFPTMVEVIRTIRPRAFIIENVKGLTRSAFTNYFAYIIHQLTYPDIAPRRRETWLEHLARLEKAKTEGHQTGLAYNVAYRLLNAADYGVPQRRERVFIVGFRSDQQASWSFPDALCSLDALLRDQWITDVYWDRHGVPKKTRPVLTPLLKCRVDKLKELHISIQTRPWRTVRDAIAGLPEPRSARLSLPNHRFQPGAKPYPGHTGSPLDLPAKTLKAGGHGVPGGENMMVGEGGKVRYFTVRESARLQTFPDGYVFHGVWSEAMRQLGNAVPVNLAHLVASSVARALLSVQSERYIRQIMPQG